MCIATDHTFYTWHKMRLTLLCTSCRIQKEHASPQSNKCHSPANHGARIHWISIQTKNRYNASFRNCDPLRQVKEGIYSGPQYKNIIPSTKVSILVQQLIFRYKNIYCNTLIVFPSTKKFPSTKTFLGAETDRPGTDFIHGALQALNDNGGPGEMSCM